MKRLLIFAIAVTLLACNNSVKTPDVSATENEPEPEPDTVTVIDSVSPVYTPEEEVKIKEDSLVRVKQKFPYLLKHPFENYKAPVFEGTPAAPDFKNNPYADDAEYVAFITKGCKKGINFGGHYTLIHKSCGAMCEFLFIVDRKNGKIFTGNLGLKGVDGYYGFTYKKNSYMLITDSTVLIDASTDQFYGDAIVPEVHKWNGNKFKKLD